MAGEITTQASLFVNSGGFRRAFSIEQDAQDIGNKNVAAAGPQLIGATAEALDVGTVAECGVAYFKNLDDAVDIEIGTGTLPFVPFLRLGPGQTAGPLWLGTDAPTAEAASGAVELDFFILDRGEST